MLGNNTVEDRKVNRIAAEMYLELQAKGKGHRHTVAEVEVTR